MDFKGFISYSHGADGKLAPAVHHALHRIAKPWYRLRTMRIFRDQTNLGANPGLWSAIESALNSSEFFLFMASPRAAQSPWVQKEVAWWLTHRSAKTFLILLTEGEIAWDEANAEFDWAVTTALPKQLSRVFAEEPLYTDLRWAKSADQLSTRHSQFRAAILNVAATLLQRPKDELDGDDVRQYRKARRLAWSGVASLVVLLVSALIAAYLAAQQRNLALRRLADLCKSLDEAQVLSDASNQGSVYYFRSEFAEIAEQCKTVSYQAWH
ncbi:MAG TPA: toll/interleukin-1 receptor domain-containing protein [Candidatus Binatia bacterium]|jgi:hypothetical protein